jgi:membrane protein YdbS with pleckstrin-like domain
MKIFKPSPRYLIRLRVVITMYALAFLTLGILTAWVASVYVESTSQTTRIVQGVIIADLIWYLPALKMVQSSYRARSYQFDEGEIIIKTGWWTESVRHIPLSSVISFNMRWDRLDRWLEIGTLEVYLASRHHVDGSRIRLTGLADIETVAQLANLLLKRMQNARLAEWSLPNRHQERNLLSHRY